MENVYPSTCASPEASARRASSGNTQKDIWNKFVIENNGLFLQSWEWGEFQKSLNRKIWRIKDENFQALVVKYELPLGKNYLYCPGGPGIKFQHLTPTLSSDEERGQNTAKNFLDKVKKIGKQEKAIFLKVEPFTKINNFENSSPAGELFSKFWLDLGFKKSSGGQNILKTLILDLTKSEEELLTEMKQKTRYNIRLAEKHGIKIRISNEPEKDIEWFWQLARETSQRDGFHLHPRGYYENMVKFFQRNWMPDQVRHDKTERGLGLKLFLAEYNSKIIAANIVMFFGNWAVYLHGASSNEHRNLMSPYFLQWEQIKEAKKRGYKVYDFWGINETKWPGVTRFKKGFGGKEIEYIGAYDYILNKKWYWLYCLAKKL